MSEKWTRDSGSALVMAMFVLVLLTGMGTALLFLSRQEAKMGQAGLRMKKVFYMAEAAVEDGRTTLFATNGDGPFSDDLLAHAGADGEIDFDPDDLRATYDGNADLLGVVHIPFTQ